MLIRFLSATVLTRVPSRPALTSFLVLGGITCLLAPFAKNYLYIILIQFIHGTAFGAIKILSAVLVAAISIPDSRGTANSILLTFESLGRITQLATSSIVEIYGFTLVFILGGVASLVATIPQLVKLEKARSD